MTHRTELPRSLALDPRSGAAPAPQRGDGFAALLDAQAPPAVRPTDASRPWRPGADRPRDAVRGAREQDDAAARGPEAHPLAAARGEDASLTPAGGDERAAAGAPLDGISPAGDVSIAPSGEGVLSGAPADPIPPVVVVAPVPAPAGAAIVAPVVGDEAAAPSAPPRPAVPIAGGAVPAPAAVVTDAVAPSGGSAPLPVMPPSSGPPTAPVAGAAPPDVGRPAPVAPPASPAPPPAAPASSPPSVAPAAFVAAPAPAEAPVPAAPSPVAAAPAPEAEAAAPVAPVDSSGANAAQGEPGAPAPLPGHVAPHRAAPLHRAPAAVAALLHVAAERGISRARMALRPAELGGIEIRLQATAAGVAAQVVADSPEAARLLAQAGDDLRRALEARDVTLVSLEVSTSGDDRRESSARGERPGDHGEAAITAGARERAAADEVEPAPRSVIELPGGLLVDVLA